MRRLSALIALVVGLYCLPANADHVKNTDVLDDMTLSARGYCTVNETGQGGFCELYYDSQGVAWLAFFDRPGRVLWVRRGNDEGNGYEYLYRDLGDYL